MTAKQYTSHIQNMHEDCEKEGGKPLLLKQILQFFSFIAKLAPLLEELKKSEALS